MDEAQQKKDRTTAGLYRLLLRECRQIAIDANNNAGSNISSSNKSDKDVLEGNLLLQPPVDTEEFGRIRPLFRNSNINNDNTSKRSSNSDNSSSDDGSDNKQVPNNNVNLPSFVDHTVSAVSESATTSETADAAADDRAAWNIIAFFTTKILYNTPLEPPTANASANNNPADFHFDKGWLAIHGRLNSNSQSNSLPYAGYQYNLVTPSQLVHAARSAFIRAKRIRPSTTPRTAEDWAKAKAGVVSLQRIAIDAVPLLHAQRNLMDCTSVSFDEQRGVRIVATSKYKSRGLLSRGAGMERMQQEEHVFVYRIRIEYCNNAGSGKPIQLLGRRWRITDGQENKADGIPGDGLDDDHDEPDVQVVNAPRTGVVGYHPVLQPGDAFEYTSGCNLISSLGSMEGGFYFCELDDDDLSTDGTKKLARIGDERLPAFKYEDWDDEEENKAEGGSGDLNSKNNNEARFFECAVAPFLLDASK